MKITTEKKFTSVIITLETQEEVNEFYAILNHLTISKCLPHLMNYDVELEKYSTGDYRITHEALESIVKPIIG